MPNAEAKTLSTSDTTESHAPVVIGSTLQDMARQEDAQRDWALFLDIDGTLLRHVPDPRDAVVDDDLRRLLAVLATRLGGAMAFVSGRRLAMIRTMLGPLSVHAAGL